MASPDPAVATARLLAEDWMPEGEWQRRHLSNVALAQNSDAKIVLYGASIIEGWQLDESLKTISDKTVLGLGLGGDNTHHLLWRLQNGEAGKLEPEIVLTMIGNNNIGHHGHAPAEVAGGVFAVDDEVKKIFPKARRIYLAILPSCEKADDPYRFKIRKTNTTIMIEAAAKGFEVFDLANAILETNGSIITATAEDFLHPTALGYEKLAKALREALE